MLWWGCCYITITWGCCYVTITWERHWFLKDQSSTTMSKHHPQTHHTFFKKGFSGCFFFFLILCQKFQVSYLGKVDIHKSSTTQYCTITCVVPGTMLTRDKHKKMSPTLLQHVKSSLSVETILSAHTHKHTHTNTHTHTHIRRVPGTARDFSPRVNFHCWFSYGVWTAPLCSRMHQHLSVHQKSQTLFEYTKTLHTLTGVGSAALTAAVP